MQIKILAPPRLTLCVASPEQAPAPLRGNTLKLITKEPSADTRCLRGDILMSAHLPRRKMTTTILELLANLKIYPSDTVVTIKDVDDQEFSITDFQSEGNALTIVIGEKEYEEEEDDEKS
ncbi:hypothetical protein NLP_5532 [Nostoc sp. 'Lobaria pulmonaria (5183) cyanobiont']|nr:hypothetical protein NLP_5532 [Nostoc sp. 'Lobaria pulmonaria (5183) cyanobiont']